MNLSNATIMDQLIITAVKGAKPQLKQNLYALGLLPGAKIYLKHSLKRAKIIIITVQNASIALRKNEADHIHVTKV
jgi:Fe2+ transport system protein FeoA